MARYDRGYGGPRGGWRGQGGGMGRGFPEPDLPPFAPPRRPGGYAGGGWDREHGGGPPQAFGRGGPGGFSRGPSNGRAGGYGSGGYSGGGYGGGGYGAGGFGGGPGWRGGADRGVYGGAYEEYGGYPGGPVRGESYGVPGGGRPTQGRGYDGQWGGGGGYAREPFMPEEAYQRHPEYRQDRQPRDWEAHQGDHGDEHLTDDEVRDAVYGRMSADAWLDPDRIDVQVEDGVVTLTGEVDDFMEARYAWDDAWEADGVRGVVNNLTVRADLPHESHGDVVIQSAGGSTAEDPRGMG